MTLFRPALGWTPLGAARVKLEGRFPEAGRSVPQVRSDLPAWPADLRAAMAAQDEGEELLFLCWELARCAPALPSGDRRTVMLLALAAGLNLRAGSTRLPLSGEGRSALERLLKTVGASEDDLPRVDALLQRARAAGTEPDGVGALFGGPEEGRPLVLEGAWLYHHRLWRFEQDLVARLRARLDAPPRAWPEEQVSAALGDVVTRHPVMGGAPVNLSTEQQRALLSAMHGRLTVVSGGPGTGKTSIVVSMLRVLARLGVQPAQVGLAAPTGKAANRMHEAIQGYLRAVAHPAEVDRQLQAGCPMPQTLHRLLGYSPGRDRFHHYEGNPLSQEVVIIDEGSMIDLFLVDRLVRAVRPEGHLVLLGDADQLPSVEAGAVFRDLLPPPRAVRAQPWHRLAVPVPEGAPEPPPWREGDDRRGRSAVRLTRSYRMDPARPEGRNILGVAQAINAGNTEALWSGGETGEVATLRTGASEVVFSGVEILECLPGEANFDQLWRRWFDERIAGDPSYEVLIAHRYRQDEAAFVPDDVERLRALFRLLEETRVLCITRGQGVGTGAEALNALFGNALAVRIGRAAEGEGMLLPGTPVMMQRNDYVRELFNGDQGVVLAVASGGRSVPHAVFPVRGAFRAFPLESMDGEVKPSFAMTVHKAQGSEFSSVALCLPGEEMPLLTRELLYTALTRARRSVTVVGRRDLLESAVRASVERFSGVGSRLAQGL